MITKVSSRRTLFAKILVLAVAGCGAADRNGHGAAGSPGGAAGTSGTGGALGTGLGGAGSGGTVAAGGSTASGGAAGHGSADRGGSGESGGASGGGGSVGGATGGASGVAGSVGGSTGGATGSAAGSTAGATGIGGNRDAATDAAPDGATDGSVGTKDGSASDAAAPSCSASQSVPKPGDTTVTMQSGGRSRRYIQHVPSGLAAGISVAVVIDLHGAGGDGRQQQGLSGFNALADKEKFLAIFPDGIDGYWNVDDKCCGTAGKEKVDDVGFLKAIVAKLSVEICIDAKRIYVTGFSNGGGLAHRMGCDAANIVAAIAPAATDLRTQPCNAARPISMVEVKGMADSLEPYEGGLVGPDGGQYVAVGAKASQKLWAESTSAPVRPRHTTSTAPATLSVQRGWKWICARCPTPITAPTPTPWASTSPAVVWTMFRRQPMK